MKGCIGDVFETDARRAMAGTLERWLDGELDARGDAAVRAHLPRCAACTREVSWLRAERALFDARARSRAVPPPELATVLARASRRGGSTAPAIHRSTAARLRGVATSDRSMLGLGLCAAAALLCMWLPSSGLRGEHGVAVGPAPEVVIPTANGGLHPGDRDASCVSQEVVDSCQPLASFDDTVPARASMLAPPIEAPPADEEARVCSAEDAQSAMRAPMCAASEL